MGDRHLGDRVDAVDLGDASAAARSRAARRPPRGRRSSGGARLGGLVIAAMAVVGGFARSRQRAGFPTSPSRGRRPPSDASSPNGPTRGRRARRFGRVAGTRGPGTVPARGARRCRVRRPPSGRADRARPARPASARHGAGDHGRRPRWFDRDARSWSRPRRAAWGEHLLRAGGSSSAGTADARSRPPGDAQATPRRPGPPRGRDVALHGWMRPPGSSIASLEVPPSKPAGGPAGSPWGARAAGRSPAARAAGRAPGARCRGPRASRGSCCWAARRAGARPRSAASGAAGAGRGQRRAVDGWSWATAASASTPRRSSSSPVRTSTARSGRGGPHSAQPVEPGGVGQVEVEQHAVHASNPRAAASAGGARGAGHRRAGPLELVLDDQRVAVVVLDEQHADRRLDRSLVAARPSIPRGL